MVSLKIDKSYESFRWFFTSDGNLVVGGKSDDQNEEVLKNFLKPKYVVLHTSEPGSPFMIIQTKDPSKKEIDEAAVFCACFSKQWKLVKEKISIDIFLGEQIYKSKLMKTGTFGVKGKVDRIIVRPELAIVIQKGKIRAVPKTTKEEIICKITPGNLTKEQAADKILKTILHKYQLGFSKQEIMAAIPSDKIEVR